MSAPTIADTVPETPATRPYLRLTELLGAPVRDADGARVGRIADVAVRLDDTFPPVAALLVCPRRGAEPVVVPTPAVTAITGEGAVVAAPLPPAGTVPDDLLLLGRDVLDVQVVDTASRRMARVGDVDLAQERGELRLIAVDVGWRAILRRLGLHALARRASRDALDWAGLHLASGYGHPLQLAAPAAAVHRLDAGDLAELLAKLPVARGGEILETVASARGAAALAAVHPELGADLVEVLTPERALRLLGQMPDDEAADALRDADADRRAGLLARLTPARAARLRSLIDAPAAPTAGAPRPRHRYWNVLRGHKGFLR